MSVVKIKLSENVYATIDQEDFETVSKFNWFASKSTPKTIYAKRREGKNKIGDRSLYMHRLITGAKKGEYVDHIDRNGLNNTRKNLRICNVSQNCMNRDKQSNNSSGFKGVSWRKDTNKWAAYIKINRRKISLGSFENIIDAAKTYDSYAVKLFKEFAKTNFA